ncbi:MAG: hypothetical protein A3F11_00625 [Gammaproteobacteria bacterium RIFCSPHIGHO2_12_FULL_37_14]|nr:MAG: hypothetical protein A3F11_00625 [Gammaproteobacteria bacterium RIFCSPHIGHO2_12_FULL_37_14]
MNDKNILLGITGGISAYKSLELIRLLKERGYSVRVVMTKHAQAFITPLSFQAISGNPVHTELMDETIDHGMRHIELAQWAEIIIIAPASTNVIAKIASGICDDLLTTVCLASPAKLFIIPSMNKAMWENTATKKNVEKLRVRNIEFIGPESGLQACGDDGFGRMTEPAEIVSRLHHNTEDNYFWNNKKIIITTGATQAPIDPVRFITNKSSGKMGYALAEAAYLLGAQVTVISGETSVNQPSCHCFIKAKTASEMQKAVENKIETQDIFICVAAVSDYTVANVSAQKIKRGRQSLMLELIPTSDILATICAKPKKPFCVGFAAETENVLENAKQKRLKKGADLIVVNDVSQPDIGFESDDNAVSIISENEIINLEKNTKQKIAQQLLKIISNQYQLQKRITA